ncbi:MAG: hypothetical protein V4773_11720 [Verrucomicrobiota bacterium]
MKRVIVWAFLMCGFAMVGRAAEENFSKSVPPADFSAAGLGKLSPEELARLDALVLAFKSGALEAARREATVAAENRVKAESKARAEAEQRAVRAEAKAKAVVAESEKKSEGSLLTRAKVLLTPGTKIEYSTVDATLVGDFSGWRPKMVFTLDNGQRWQVISSDSYVTKAEPGMKVKIVPGALGAFWMHFDGHRQRAKVAILETK